MEFCYLGCVTFYNVMFCSRVLIFVLSFVCILFLDVLTEEEEERVATAVRRFLAEFVGRGNSPSPDDIIRFSESARVMMRNARPAPKPNQKTGNCWIFLTYSVWYFFLRFLTINCVIYRKSCVFVYC